MPRRIQSKVGRVPWTSEGVRKAWMLSRASSFSVARDFPSRAHLGGESIATIDG